MTKKCTLLVLVAIWSVAIAIALPAALCAESAENELGEVVACGTVWSEEQSEHDKVDLAYNCMMVAVQYVVPLGLLCFAYARVGRVLWNNPAFGVTALICKPSQNPTSILAKRRVVCMMITVVSAFGSCWLPMHAYFAITLLRPDYRHHVVYLLCFQVRFSITRTLKTARFRHWGRCFEPW